MSFQNPIRCRETACDLAEEEETGRRMGTPRRGEEETHHRMSTPLRGEEETLHQMGTPCKEDAQQST
jgi:hypothetical protein